MKEHRSSSWFENDQWRDYPPPGEVLETNDIHAADLCRQGVAVPVAEERAAETRPAPDTAEKRAAKPAAAAKEKD
jgi:hypothetical protein